MANNVAFSAEKARLGLVQEDGKPVQVTGYGVIWNEISSQYTTETGEAIFYRFSPGSAQPAANVQGRYMHVRGQILGSTDAGTMRIGPPDEYGVPFTIDLPDTTLGRDVAVLLARKEIKASSVGMTKGSGTEVLEGGKKIRQVEHFIYPEISIVDEPGFASATAHLVEEFEVTKAQAETVATETATTNTTSTNTNDIEPIIEERAPPKKPADHSKNLQRLRLHTLRRQRLARGD